MTRHTMPPALQRFVDFLAANPSPTEVVAGNYYKVPCAIMPAGRKWAGLNLRRLPLLGTVHEDRDVIQFHVWHVHIDSRFISHSSYWGYELIARPLSLTSNFPFEGEMLDPLADAVLDVLRCRAFRPEPPKWPRASWLPALEDLYADASASCGVCPHRQIPLTAGRQRGDGVRQCPGHGLCWDRDGRLVRQEVAA